MSDREREIRLQQAMRMVKRVCDRYGARLTARDLEALSDLLLRLCGPDEEYPYTEERRMETGRRGVVVQALDSAAPLERWQMENRPAPPPPAVPGVVQVIVARLVVAAGLTGQRRQVVRLRLWGYRLKEVAELLKLPLRSVYAHWHYAQPALREALAQGGLEDMPAVGVSEELVQQVDAFEVFRREQDRCVYMRPTHCASGRELCRTSGVCPFAASRVR